MRQGASDRAAIANLKVADEWHRLVQQRRGRLDQPRAFDDALPRHGADGDPTILRRDVRESDDAVEVDEVPWPRETEGQ